MGYAVGLILSVFGLYVFITAPTESAAMFGIIVVTWGFLYIVAYHAQTAHNKLDRIEKQLKINGTLKRWDNPR